MGDLEELGGFGVVAVLAMLKDLPLGGEREDLLRRIARNPVLAELIQTIPKEAP